MLICEASEVAVTTNLTPFCISQNPDKNIHGAKLTLSGPAHNL